MTTETKVVQLKLPGFDKMVEDAQKRGIGVTKVPYLGRSRIHAKKTHPRKK